MSQSVSLSLRDHNSNRAPAFFRRLDDSEKAKVFAHLAEQPALNESGVFDFRDAFCRPGARTLRKKRPALLVSSTSWTPDEDFSLLENAILAYDEWAAKQRNATELVVAITGKGPLLKAFQERMRARAPSMRCVTVLTLWLEAELYPRFLGACDLGVSLHTSSSGLDLPMKVVDMFGAGLPVCSVDYECLHELVDSSRGLTFRTSDELCAQLRRLLSSSSRDELERLAKGADKWGSVRWSDGWTQLARPAFQLAPR